MTKHSGTKLVPIEVRHEEQSLETDSQPEQSELPMSELDIEVQCPRCMTMELCSSFDMLVYSCESCSFFVKVRIATNN
jgi:hypothetical protein